jgi:hypothetical protein
MKMGVKRQSEGPQSYAYAMTVTVCVARRELPLICSS